MIIRLRRPVVGLSALALAAALLAIAAWAISPGGPAGPTDPAAAAATASSAGTTEPSPTPEPTPTPAATPTPGPAIALPIAPYRATVPSASDEVRLELGRTLRRLVAEQRIPGASVAIIYPDGTVWTGVAGLADVAAVERVTAETGFALASISKTFTAAAAMALVEDGRLDLDASAATLLPARSLDRRITIRMLLDHTSGLHDFFLDPAIDVALQGDRAATWTTARSLSHVKQPYFEPGAGWRYSNTNYLYLAEIVERIEGRPLAAVLRDRFFEPLELDSLSYQTTEAPRAELAHGYRVSASGAPTDLSDGSAIVPFTSVVTAADGAGAIAGTALDTARWARALYTDEVLEPATLERMVGAAFANASRPRGAPYGLGVQAYPIDGRFSLGHSGRFLGFQGAVRHLPDDGLTIAVLTNQSRVDPAVITRALVTIAAPPPPACRICPVID